MPAVLTVGEAWERSEHGMVVLGELGAGKSVQLLLLAKALLLNADRDRHMGVPIIIGLADCELQQPKRGEKKSNLELFEEWISTYVSSRFRIPKGSVPLWMVGGQLIPILDGLDEVGAPQLRQVFEGLRGWLTNPARPVAAWALGSRIDEYVDLDPNFKALGKSHVYWRVKPLDDADRVRFLESLDPSEASSWGPVIQAMRDRADKPQPDPRVDGLGPLGTPLGLTTAVEAYAGSRADDGRGRPADLLSERPDWDRMWTRYVERSFSMSHADPGDHAGVPERYSLDDARRLLGNMASGRLGLRGAIDIVQVPIPRHPSQWELVSDAARRPFLVMGGLVSASLLWVLLFAPFGAILGWRRLVSLRGRSCSPDLGSARPHRHRRL